MTVLSGERVGKLILSIETDYNNVRTKAEQYLWLAGEDRARWSDIVDRAAENSSFYWLPAKGLETLKRCALERGNWEDEGNGWINKKPPKKKTSVQIIVMGDMTDDGKVRLQVSPINAGKIPRIFVSE